MIYAALFVACVALVAAAAACVIAVRAHSVGSWAADALRTQARTRAAQERGRERGQAAAEARSRHSAPTDTTPATPGPPAAAERAGQTREYRAVPPPGDWSQR